MPRLNVKATPNRKPKNDRRCYHKDCGCFGYSGIHVSIGNKRPAFARCTCGHLRLSHGSLGKEFEKR